MIPGMMYSTCCEARPLAQVVMLHVDLKIRLLPEVPGTGCAAKQLLLIAVLHRQMHLNGRRWGKKKKAIQVGSFLWLLH